MTTAIKKMALNVAADELQRCDDMAQMVLDREWAEHAGKEAVSSKVEQAFTQLHIELAERPALTVWYGPMPESNGKSNFTAVLMRKGMNLFDGLTGGITIERSEYPDRVRYEADRMRYLIGELDEEPDLLAYDADKHSGYVKPQTLETEAPLFGRIVSHMKDCGWEESELDGMITNPNVTDGTFDSWEEAIKSCIEVASEV